LLRHSDPRYHIPSLDALKSRAASKGGREALEHAASISTGGPPVIVMSTDDPSVTM